MVQTDGTGLCKCKFNCRFACLFYRPIHSVGVCVCFCSLMSCLIIIKYLYFIYCTVTNKYDWLIDWLTQYMSDIPSCYLHVFPRQHDIIFSYFDATRKVDQWVMIDPGSKRTLTVLDIGSAAVAAAAAVEHLRQCDSYQRRQVRRQTRLSRACKTISAARSSLSPVVVCVRRPR